MEIRVKRIEAPFVLEATNETGNTLTFDASPDIGGHGKGFRPMETLLASLGGCSSIDVLHILQKGRQDVKGIEVVLEADREPVGEASLFKNIHIHYVLYGPLDQDRVKRAIDLSLEKYCSVAKTLEKTATITSSFQIMQ